MSGKEKIITHHDIENKQLKEKNKKLNENDNDNDNDNYNYNENKNENENENENEKRFKKIVKDSNIKELIEEPKEIKCPNWIDKNKFKNVLTIIDSNKFGYKNGIDELKYTDIKNLVDNIKNNTISEIYVKKRLNTLKIIKNSEIKHRRLIPEQKELLNLFDDLSNIIVTDKTLMSSKEENKKLNANENENENEHENKYENENENENVNENDETMSSKDNDNEIIKILLHSDEYYKTVDQNEKNKNDHLDKIIDKSKSFENQIESLEKVKNLEEYCFIISFDDKELRSKIFKLKLAHLSNIIGKKIFEQIF